MQGDPLVAAAAVAAALERLGVKYAIGGSLASSLYGIPRATQDADIIAALAAAHADPLAERLAGTFHVDASMIRDAVRRRSSFNVVHLATMFKVDVFVAKDDEWSSLQLSRAQRERIGGAGESVELLFASPEDTLLHKLVWYRLGGETSDRQWRDAVGVVRVQDAALDAAYLAAWAPRLGVDDLLARARADARRT